MTVDSSDVGVICFLIGFLMLLGVTFWTIGLIAALTLLSMFLIFVGITNMGK